MVVLADEILESFFEMDFSATFRLEPVPIQDIPNSNTGLLGDLWHNIASDDNRKIFNRFTDGIGKTIGKHQVRCAMHTFATIMFILSSVYRSSPALPSGSIRHWKSRRHASRS